MKQESTLFKDVFFKPGFIKELSDALDAVLPVFDKKKFQAEVFDEAWGSKELKQRTRHLVHVLHRVLPSNFPDAANAIVKIVQHLRSQPGREGSFGYICLPEYIEVYGVDSYKESVKAMEYITQFMSCEFAVRPFILKYEDKMMKQMLVWAGHKDARVRRLASEGCRPRLPWAMALPEFKKDPARILPILEKLKTDTDVWVHKSVANNLNDISKDNPQLAITIFKSWLGKSKTTDWIVKHAARTLLKQGNAEVMALFGFKKDKNIVLSNFVINTPKVPKGKHLEFTFQLQNKGKKAAVIRVEYGMYYLRANGSHTKKVFKISEREYQGGSTTAITRRQSFKPITTRTYYPGVHKVSVIINGHEMAVEEFLLQ